MALLGQVVIQLHSSKGEDQSSLVALLDCLTLVMAPIAYLEGLIELLKVPDNDIRRKVSRESIEFCLAVKSNTFEALQVSCSVQCSHLETLKNLTRLFSCTGAHSVRFQNEDAG